MSSPQQPPSQPSPETVQYAALAERFWRTYRPSAVAAMAPGDVERFFLSLGWQIADSVGYLTDSNLAAARKVNERQEQRARREAMAHARAEEESLRELLYDVEKEPGTEDREMPALHPQV